MFNGSVNENFTKSITDVAYKIIKIATSLANRSTKPDLEIRTLLEETTPIRNDGIVYYLKKYFHLYVLHKSIFFKF